MTEDNKIPEVVYLRPDFCPVHEYYWMWWEKPEGGAVAYRRETPMVAAAPDLLAACKAALQWLDEVCTKPPDQYGIGYPNPAADAEWESSEGVMVRKQIEAAIARAKGEQP